MRLIIFSITMLMSFFASAHNWCKRHPDRCGHEESKLEFALSGHERFSIKCHVSIDIIPKGTQMTVHIYGSSGTLYFSEAPWFGGAQVFHIQKYERRYLLAVAQTPHPTVIEIINLHDTKKYVRVGDLMGKNGFGKYINATISCE